MSELKNNLAEILRNEFADSAYAHSYMEAHEAARIAAQIRILREQRNLTQVELAELAGMKQERISTIEKEDYNAWTLATLRKLARAFDVHLHVQFVTFNDGIRDVVNLNRRLLEVESRESNLKHFDNGSVYSFVLPTATTSGSAVQNTDALNFNATTGIKEYA